jgi:hypothetical protein
MAVKKSNKAIIWITVSILVIGGGIGLYFLLKKPKDEESTEDTGGTEDKSTSGSGSSKSENVKIDKPDWVDTKKFQTWMDENHPYFYKDTDGKYKNFCKATTGYERVSKVCGGWGQQTQKAWNTYGKKYAEFVGEKISNIKEDKKEEKKKKTYSNPYVPQGIYDMLYNFEGETQNMDLV